MTPPLPTSNVPSTLYRGFTRAELDRAYSPSSMVTSITPYLERYATDSAAARAGFAPDAWTVERYGEGAAHTIDVFPTRVPAPLLVFFHGGYWQALGKGDSSFPAPHLVAAGFGYAAVDYTLAPAASLDAIVEECRRALCHLWAARNRLGVGAHGVVLAGHSAGAHLVAMLLATDWQALGVDPGFVNGALLIGGIFDLEPISQSYVNDALSLDAAAARRNSPVHQTPRVDCPLVVTWGEHETLEFKRQSCDFASVWSRHLPRVTTFELEGVNHFDALFGWCLPTSRLFRETIQLLRDRR